MRTAWIPEAPNHPGLYANLTERERSEKISHGLLAISTHDAYSARQFATREECQAWCDANPTPVFVPREHEFEEASTGAAR